MDPFLVWEKDRPAAGAVARAEQAGDVVAVVAPPTQD
jgi:hypothetical protein